MIAMQLTISEKKKVITGGFHIFLVKSAFLNQLNYSFLLFCLFLFFCELNNENQVCIW